MKIVVGYDGSTASNEIFDDLPFAGLPKDGEAIVVTAAGVLVPMSRTSNPAIRAWSNKWDEERLGVFSRTLAIAEEGARRLREALPTWSVTTEANADVAPWAVMTVAERVGADMIVVGAQGHSRVSRFLGSVSQQIVGNAHCSVRVSRAPKLMDRGEPRVLLAINGTREAGLVTEEALHRSWMSITPVRVVVVARRRQKNGDLLLEDFTAREMERYRKAGLSASKAIRRGVAADNILAEAKKWNATSILLGCRELNPLRRFLMGSTSIAVAGRAHCSVEVVRGHMPAANEIAAASGGG